MTAPDNPLVRLLGGQARRDLRQRLRRPFERATDENAEPVGFRLNALPAEDVTLLASLMGRVPRLEATSIEIDVAAIDAGLARAGLATSLKAALERLDGPIERRAERQAVSRRRWAEVAGMAQDRRLGAWLAAASGLGLLKRLSRHDADAATQLCAAADDVLRHLPAGGTPRAELAARVLGDAHALDGGQPTATVLLAALRHTDRLAALRDATDADEAVAAERDRHVWARAGVLVNELARPALVLNLPVTGEGVWGGRPGDPAHITLRALVRATPHFDVGGVIVSICENPNVVALVADRLGPAAAPLVCTEGMPAAAQRTLLLALAEAGAKLRYHGDFDWPGLRIAATVFDICAATPWRFGADDYRAAVARRRGSPLTASAAASAWDPALATAMLSNGLSIAEEAMTDDLLEDLDLRSMPRRFATVS